MSWTNVDVWDKDEEVKKFYSLVGDFYFGSIRYLVVIPKDDSLKESKINAAFIIENIKKIGFIRVFKNELSCIEDVQELASIAGLFYSMLLFSSFAIQ